MADGTRRAGDNWQNGFPEDVLTESFFRHAMDVWMLRRGIVVIDERAEEVTLEDAVMGAVFNLQAMIHQARKGKDIERGA
jgi:ABC-type cobalamin transport system ATPase subunit